MRHFFGIFATFRARPRLNAPVSDRPSMCFEIKKAIYFRKMLSASFWDETFSRTAPLQQNAPAPIRTVRPVNFKKCVHFEVGHQNDSDLLDYQDGSSIANGTFIYFV